MLDSSRVLRLFKLENLVLSLVFGSCGFFLGVLWRDGNCVTSLDDESYMFDTCTKNVLELKHLLLSSHTTSRVSYARAPQQHELNKTEESSPEPPPEENHSTSRERILITGITGMIGSQTARQLLGERASKIHLFGIMRWRSDRRNLRGILDSITVYYGDIEDHVFMTTTIKAIRPDIIFHYAAQAFNGPSWGSPDYTLRVNILGTLNVLEAVRQNGLTNSRIFVAGSSAVYGLSAARHPITEETSMQPTSPYGVSKAATELLAKMYHVSYGLHITVARIFLQVGTGHTESVALQNFARQIAMIESGLQEPVLLTGNLDARRDLSPVTDAVKAYIRLAEMANAPTVDGKAFNVGSRRSFSERQLLEKLIELSNKDIEIKENQDSFHRPYDEPELLANNHAVTATVPWFPDPDIHKALIDILNYWREEIRARYGSAARHVLPYPLEYPGVNFCGGYGDLNTILPDGTVLPPICPDPNECYCDPGFTDRPISPKTDELFFQNIEKMQQLTKEQCDDPDRRFFFFPLSTMNYGLGAKLMQLQILIGEAYRRNYDLTHLDDPNQHQDYDRRLKWTVIFAKESWPMYFGDCTDGLGCLFNPIDNCNFTAGDARMIKQAEYDPIMAVSREVFYVRQYVPDQLALAGKSVKWFRSMITGLFRPNKRLADMVDQIKKDMKWTPKARVVGMHVRTGADKFVGGEQHAMRGALIEYEGMHWFDLYARRFPNTSLAWHIDAIQRLNRQLERLGESPITEIYLATDSNAVVESTSQYPEYTWMVQPDPTRGANYLAGQTSSDQVVVDMLLLAECEFLINTMSSCFARAAYQFGLAKGTTRGAISLDTGWYNDP